MTRNRRARPELTESWDDMDDYEEDRQIYDEDEERDEMGEEYRPRTYETRASLADSRDLPRRRNLRSSVEPELVMPSPDVSPNKASSKRASTPHIRSLERSLTSDAGELRKKTRSATPRTRKLDRSTTSDAGNFRASKLSQHRDADYDSEEEDAAQPATMLWQRVLRPVVGYLGSVAALALQNLKPLLAYGLLLYLVVAALVFAGGFLTNSINNALTPICRLPFTSHLSFCPVSTAPEVQGNAEFGKLVQAQDAFQEVLAESATGAQLPLDMKRGEASIRDLKHVVQYSQLPSKNELVFEFGGFIDTARQASQDLSRFNSRIGRAVDHILSTNRWTLSVIDGVEAKEASKGAISKWFNNNLNIFAPFQPLSLSRDVLLDQYLRHTNAVEEQIINLINEAFVLRDILENLDGRLDVISEIATRDGIKIGSTKDELFATLWTKLGGNRASVAKVEKQLKLLNDVNTYRRAAWGHVTATILKLQEIQHNLEDLRERVALPETVGTAKVPLEIHIEAINLGIERLENQRDASRKLEAENYARIVSRAEAEDRNLIGSTQGAREL